MWMLPRVPSHPPIPATPLPAPITEAPEPMQLGLLRAPLTPEEKQRRRMNNLCLYCVGAGHYANMCPNKTRKCDSPPLDPCALTLARSTHIAVPVSLQLPEGVLQVQAIVS